MSFGILIYCIGLNIREAYRLVFVLDIGMCLYLDIVVVKIFKYNDTLSVVTEGFKVECKLLLSFCFLWCKGCFCFYSISGFVCDRFSGSFVDQSTLDRVLFARDQVLIAYGIYDRCCSISAFSITDMGIRFLINRSGVQIRIVYRLIFIFDVLMVSDLDTLMFQTFESHNGLSCEDVFCDLKS